MNRIRWRWLLPWLLAPLAAWGQAAVQSGSSASPAAAPYGSGEQDQPSLANALPAHDFLLLGVDFSSRWDDNVRQSNSNRVADTGFVVSPLMDFRREGGRLGLDLSYQPTVAVYRHQTDYNEQDHSLRFDGSYRATQRLTFRARTSLLYRNGILQSFPDSATTPDLVGPATLNSTIITPFANQFEDNSRIDINYQLSRHSTLSAFTTYMLRSFALPTGSTANLLDTEGKSVGAEYTRQLSRTFSAGVLYVFEDLHFGPNTRLGVHNPNLSLAIQLTPHVSFYGFAGPEYTSLHDTLLVPVGPFITFAIPVARSNWYWAAGGGLTAQGERTVLEINGSHQVTDGGGLLDAVTTSMAGVSLERQLARRWSVQWAGGWQQTSALPSAVLQGQLEGEYGRVVFLHPIARDLTAGVGYQYQRQVATGLIPLGGTMDRNFVYFTLSYRFKDIPVGR